MVDGEVSTNMLRDAREHVTRQLSGARDELIRGICVNRGVFTQNTRGGRGGR